MPRLTPLEAPSIDFSSFAEESKASRRRALTIAFSIAAPILISFTFLDALVAPHEWESLLVSRLLGAGVLECLAYALSRRLVRVNFAALAGLAVVTIPIEFGVLASGGPASPYLYALILPAAGVGLLVPLKPAEAAVLCAEIALIGFGPVTWGLGWSAAAVEIAPASYFACISILAFVGAGVGERLRSREFKARGAAARHARLATLGQLSASLAHELSNPLTVLTSVLHLARHASPIASSEYLADAETAAQRMAGVLDAMNRGARFADGRRPVDLVHEMEVSLSLIQHRLKGTVEVERELQPVPPVLANPSLVGQLFVNLLVNAIDALAPVSSARITVRSRATPREVTVEVEDNGPGVPAELRTRIFEPFESAKAEGGNGLGLWICAEIAQSHGGSLALVQHEGRGAMFRLTIPVE